MVKLAIFGRDDSGNVDTSTRTWIVGSPNISPALWTPMDGEQRAIRRDQQMEGGAGFDFKTPLDRGNETFNETFRTTRTFQDSYFGAGDAELVAWRFCNSFSRANPNEWPHQIAGDFVLRFELPDNVYHEERIFKGLLSKPTFIRTGPTVELTYQLTGQHIEPYVSGTVFEDPEPGSGGTLPIDMFEMPLATHSENDLPSLTFFGTSVGGTPVLGSSLTWDSSLESQNGWVVDISLSELGVGVYYRSFYFGTVISPFATDYLAPPMSSQLAAMAAAIDPAFLTATVITGSGRARLQLSTVRDYSGYDHKVNPPGIGFQVWKRDQGTWGASFQRVFGGFGPVISLSEVLPIDGDDWLPAALI